MQKKLYRIEEGKILAGVCNGLGEYFGIDPNVVRLAWAVFCCFAGAPLSCLPNPADISMFNIHPGKIRIIMKGEIQ